MFPAAIIELVCTCVQPVIGDADIKGPSLHHELNVLRCWKCPACGNLVRLPGHVTAWTCDCSERPQMKLQEPNPVSSVDVTPFVSYLNEEDARDDDDGTDLPLPDPADLAAAAPESHARRHPVRPMLRDSIPTGESTGSRDSGLVSQEEEFGAGITDGDVPDGEDTRAVPDSESTDAPAGKRRRRRRRRRSRGRPEAAADPVESTADFSADSASGRAAPKKDPETTSDRKRKRRRRRRRSKPAGETAAPGDGASGTSGD